MSARQEASAAGSALVRTPLHELHLRLGARMVDFAGYALPLHYPAGIIREHLFTRAKSGLFDVSHMGQAILCGQDAARRLETLVPADVVGLAPGQMRYTLLLDVDGHIRDDLLVTRLADDERGRERLFLVVNAATKKADFSHIAAGIPECILTILEDRALIALQGPAAAAALCRQLPPGLARTVALMPFLSAQALEWNGASLHVSRSGYTGEDGFELSLGPDAAQALARKLLDDPDVHPAGLGARDSLRLEAGLCLYGHDIDETTGPVEAGLLWTIPKKRREAGGFVGAEKVKRAIADGPLRLRAGLLLEGKIPAREGSAIKGEGRIIGRVTSGGFAPSLERPIAMGYIEAAFAAPGTPLLLSVRGKELAARIVPLPFVPHRYYRGAL